MGEHRYRNIAKFDKVFPEVPGDWGIAPDGIKLSWKVDEVSMEFVVVMAIDVGKVSEVGESVIMPVEIGEMCRVPLLSLRGGIMKLIADEAAKGVVLE